MPDGMEVFESNITLQAPIELRHGGLYECVASYTDVQAALKFNITVRPRVARLGMPGSLPLAFFYDDIIKSFMCSLSMTH